MSPVSRGRKGAKSRRGGTRVLRSVPALEPDPCDCPACTGQELDSAAMLTDLMATAGELRSSDDPIEAELFASMFLSAGDLAGPEFAEALGAGLVPEIEGIGGPDALTLLLAISAVRDVPEAAEAAARLADAGVAGPAWADAARAPLTGGVFRAFRAEAAMSMLACSFERAGQRHGFLVHVDHTDCHAAAEILLIPADGWDELLRHIPRQAKRDRIELEVEDLRPEDFRWEVERALAARAVHDEEGGGDEETDGPSYLTLAELIRSRMRTLPEPSRPPAPHGEDRPVLSMAAVMGQIADFAAQADDRRRRQRERLPLPPKRKKSDGPAPIYQIKVSLAGAKPPIWRRLELPASMTLARLHRVIQVAFDWQDYHLHVFETPYGEFGVADRELGHRSDATVTVEQVAAQAGAKFGYLYDPGDDWRHEIVVEKVLGPQPKATPRCTGGRRAAPPEDCGGVGGYRDLLDVLADRGHPEHQDRLEWLGVESAEDFRPARFAAADVTEVLGKLR